MVTRESQSLALSLSSCQLWPQALSSVPALSPLVLIYMSCPSVGPGLPRHLSGPLLSNRLLSWFSQKDLPALQMPEGGACCTYCACGPRANHVPAHLRLPAPLHFR